MAKQPTSPGRPGDLSRVYRREGGLNWAGEVGDLGRYVRLALPIKSKEPSNVSVLQIKQQFGIRYISLFPSQGMGHRQRHWKGIAVTFSLIDYIQYIFAKIGGEIHFRALSHHSSHNDD